MSGMRGVAIRPGTVGKALIPLVVAVVPAPAKAGDSTQKARLFLLLIRLWPIALLLRVSRVVPGGLRVVLALTNGREILDGGHAPMSAPCFHGRTGREWLGTARAFGRRPLRRRRRRTDPELRRTFLDQDVARAAPQILRPRLRWRHRRVLLHPLRQCFGKILRRGRRRWLAGCWLLPRLRRWSVLGMRQRRWAASLGRPV